MRGSGRFSCGSYLILKWLLEVSIPFIAGQWSLQVIAVPEGNAKLDVSIPFIAGQWSLLWLRVIGEVLSLMFQSPSLRGSGRFRPLKQIYRVVL